MKLYTEEELLKYFLEHGTIDLDSFMLDMKPIELPSDEEIEKLSRYKITENLRYNPLLNIVWIQGATWMRDKIQQVNSEQ